MKPELRGQRSEVSVRATTRALLVVLLALWATAAEGQTFSLDWWTVDGGGGTSTAGVYTVSGTIGQPDAAAMSGGGYSLTGGFWALDATPTPVRPVLSIKLTGNAVMVYWSSPSTGFNLEVNPDLTTANWVTPAEPVQDNGTIKYIIVNPPTSNRFYRLKKP
jgi:hypothetical protein